MVCLKKRLIRYIRAADVCYESDVFSSKPSKSGTCSTLLDATICNFPRWQDRMVSNFRDFEKICTDLGLTPKAVQFSKIFYRSSQAGLHLLRPLLHGGLYFSKLPRFGTFHLRSTRWVHDKLGIYYAHY
jgi:hypothetical protein